MHLYFMKVKPKNIFLFLFLGIFGSVTYSQNSEIKLNIVLILVDDAALMDFGTYGGEANTPNIDKLAHQGTLFTNYHTSPSCAPSRAMLLTGRIFNIIVLTSLVLFMVVFISPHFTLENLSIPASFAESFNPFLRELIETRWSKVSPLTISIYWLLGPKLCVV
jgi:hypothetical protein